MSDAIVKQAGPADRPGPAVQFELAVSSGLVAPDGSTFTFGAVQTPMAFVGNFAHALYNAIAFTDEQHREALANADEADMLAHFTLHANKLAEVAAAHGIDITMMPHTIQTGKRQIAVTVAPAGKAA